jgi:hypothetical protein
MRASLAHSAGVALLGFGPVVNWKVFDRDGCQLFDTREDESGLVERI